MDAKRIAGGIVGGLAGGILFALMMQMMGMLGMIAGLVGQEGLAVGWVVHLAIATLFGLVFAVAFGSLATSWGRTIAFGAIYGVVWWVLGALLIMPAMLGMPVFQLGQTAFQSLVGHLVYGVALGVTFQAAGEALSARGVPSGA